MHTQTALSTITLEDGSMQSIFEVYSDESREQTLGFVYDKHLATALWSHAPLVEALEALTAAIDLSKLNVRKDFSLLNAHASALKALTLAKKGA